MPTQSVAQPVSGSDCEVLIGDSTQDDSLRHPSTPRSLSSQNEAVVFPNVPLLRRINYAIGLWTVKALVGLFIRVGKLYRKIPPSEKPVCIKHYSIRPGLKHHIFLPKGDLRGQYPLYLDIHGGGFANGWPYVDDKFCSAIAADHNMVVVSLDYSKSPKHRFPQAVTDIVETIKAVLSDDDLTIDKTRIVLGGFSAGGNLSLAAAQNVELKPLISAVVAYYPVVNFAEQIEDKLSRKASEYAKDADHLVWTAHMADWGYVPQGQNRRDPALSPFWADASSLPRHIYMIGAEKDILCSEAEMLAEKLAAYHNSLKQTEKKALPGLNVEESWQHGPICWELAKAKKHGFADTLIWWNAKDEAERVEFCKGIFTRIHSWLEETVWEKPGA